MKRDLLTINDLTSSEITALLDKASQMKARPVGTDNSLKNKSIGLLFQKPSNRTRVSFEVGIFQMGGNCLYLSPSEINLGVRESTADVAKTLSRYLDGLIARTFSHNDIIDLAQHATIPVINGLSDLYHPCQALADIMTIREKLKRLKGIKLAYIGDGNNVCHSLLLACAKTGMHMAVAAPEAYAPALSVVKQANQYAAQTGSVLDIDPDPQKAIRDADVIYTDVWVSMGQEEESQKRLHDLRDYQINADTVKKAKSEFIFMHCLPAHRGQEVTADIIDGKHSVVFDQAENRLHIQKAILDFLMKT